MQQQTNANRINLKIKIAQVLDSQSARAVNWRKNNLLDREL